MFSRILRVSGLRIARIEVRGRIVRREQDQAAEKIQDFAPLRAAQSGKSAPRFYCLTAVATVPGFWELKRTRTERPDLGARP